MVGGERKYVRDLVNLERRLNEVESLFAPWDTTHEPGLVVGIAHQGRTLYRRGFGMASLETGVANGPATRMRIGSTSKHFLALVVLLLQEEGRLNLDDPIGRHVPELTGINGKPTLRQLLQHRGGTRCHIDLGFIGHGRLAAPAGSALTILARQRGTNFAPGEAMIYCNGGYHLLSLAVSQMANAPLADVLQQRLFDPLRMVSTALVPSDYVITPGVACLHLPSRDGSWRRGLFPSEELLGEGGIVSTVDDMLAWAAHLRTRDRFGSPDLWRQLTSVVTEPEGGNDYGLGLVVSRYRGIETLRHAGGVLGGASEMICLPAVGLNIVVLSNGAKGASPANLAQAILDVLLPETLGDPTPVAVSAQYASKLGDYGSVGTGMVYSLEAEGQSLALRVAKGPRATALEVCPDGWLQTGIAAGFTGLGRIRVRPAAADCEGLVIEFAGRRERHVRIAGSMLPPTETAQIVGQYASEESGIAAEIRDTGSGTVLRTWDSWGSTEFDLISLGGGWLQVRGKAEEDLFGGVIHFADSRAGRGFRLNTARTRGLTFHSIAD